MRKPSEMMRENRLISSLRNTLYLLCLIVVFSITTTHSYAQAPSESETTLRVAEAKTLAAQYSKKIDENTNKSPFSEVSEADIPDTLGNRLAAAQRYLDAVPMEAMMLDVATESAKNFPEDARPSYIQFMTKTIRLNVIEGAALTAMTQHFTFKELNALAEFYGSPEGRSTMKKFGAYMADITPTILQEVQHAQKQLESQLAE